ncbi:MAG: HAD family hydrolase [Proteobacteria bacterium]|nr:HAD family hydrolase [Pseudomonadota bacterium]
MPLVIFDCDGVLIDSELIACRLDAEDLTAVGYPCTPEDIARDFIGLSGASMFAILEAHIGRPLPDGFVEDAHERLMAAFTEKLQPIAGIEAALAAVQAAGWSDCVASSSSPDRLRHTLGLTGLWPHFDGRVFSAAMVENGKPAPDLFLHAAATMGAAPDDCIVIEDSTAGVQAARAAGMDVLGFTGGGHCGPDHGRRLADLGACGLFSDMARLPDLIGALPR